MNCKSQKMPGQGLLIEERLTEVMCGDGTSPCKRELMQMAGTVWAPPPLTKEEPRRSLSQ